MDLKRNKRLLLALQMKAPGKGWLEFTVEKYSAFDSPFLPRGLWGYAYWFILKSFHGLLFQDILKNIIKNAGSSQA